MIETLEKKVDDGLELTQEEAFWLAEEAPLEELCEAAHRITLKYASHKFDMCSIINAKSGLRPGHQRPRRPGLPSGAPVHRPAAGASPELAAAPPAAAQLIPAIKKPGPERSPSPGPGHRQSLRQRRVAVGEDRNVHFVASRNSVVNEGS